MISIPVLARVDIDDDDVDDAGEEDDLDFSTTALDTSLSYPVEYSMDGSLWLPKGTIVVDDESASFKPLFNVWPENVPASSLDGSLFIRVAVAPSTTTVIPRGGAAIVVSAPLCALHAARFAERYNVTLAPAVAIAAAPAAPAVVTKGSRAASFAARENVRRLVPTTHITGLRFVPRAPATARVGGGVASSAGETMDAGTSYVMKTLDVVNVSLGGASAHGLHAHAATASGDAADVASATANVVPPVHVPLPLADGTVGGRTAMRCDAKRVAGGAWHSVAITAQRPVPFASIFVDPDVTAYHEALARDAAHAQKGAAGDDEQQSFLSRYKHILIPLGIYMFVMNLRRAS
eukprot:TRINITY_DN71317_c0_g1_i1.p1 TRINITY_DN71317_c0_g1~~TRINITY_DN71317_c0_g1_i1.p1  ORF type:complete len:391 (-),score=64.61 TRINITY_DN71317_c0_g1_i1:156-1202(-)